MSRTAWLLAKDDRKLAQARLSFKVAHELQAVQPDKPSKIGERSGVDGDEESQRGKAKQISNLSVDLIEFHFCNLWILPRR